MAWTAFPLLTDGTVWTGAHTQIIKANFDETAPAKATTPGSIFVTTAANTIAERIPVTAVVTGSDSVTSTAYANTTTPGPTVTATSSAKALIFTSGHQVNSTASASTYLSHEISGATTIAAADTWALEHRGGTAGSDMLNATRCHLETALTSGSNTFTVKYRVSAGTGTVQRRHITVIPF